MKLVYICSRYRADATHTVEEAVDSALYACSVAISKGYAPIAPHLYLPRCLDDNEPAERAAGTLRGWRSSLCAMKSGSGAKPLPRAWRQSLPAQRNWASPLKFTTRWASRMNNGTA